MLEPGFSNWPSKVALLTYRWSSGELPHNQATAVDVCIILCSFSCNFTLVNCILSFISWSLNCTFCIECVYQACPVSCAIVPSVVIRSSLLSCCYNSIRFYEIKKKLSTSWRLNSGHTMVLLYFAENFLSLTQVHAVRSFSLGSTTHTTLSLCVDICKLSHTNSVHELSAPEVFLYTALLVCCHLPLPLYLTLLIPPKPGYLSYAPTSDEGVAGQ